MCLQVALLPATAGWMLSHVQASAGWYKSFRTLPSGRLYDGQLVTQIAGMQKASGRQSSRRAQRKCAPRCVSRTWRASGTRSSSGASQP